MKTSNRVTIKDLMEEIEKLKERIAGLENEVLDLSRNTRNEADENISQKIILCKKCDETFRSGKDLKRHNKLNHTLPQIKCNSCEKVFHKNCDLESHPEKEHKVEKFECEKCDKTFVLKWRLIKHQKIHNGQNIKKCHYFNNQKICPFEQIGCKFLHLPAGECENSDLCTLKLCLSKHANIECNEKDTVDKSSQEEIEITEVEKAFETNVNENYPEIFENYLQNKRTIQCYYCDYKTKRKIFSNIKDEVNKHLKVEHKEVINTLEDGEMVIENLLHAEFLEFFATY